MENGKHNNEHTTIPAPGEEQQAAKKPKQSLRARILWYCVYGLIGAILVAGVVIIYRQSVIVSKYDEPAPTFVPTPAPTPTLAPAEETPQAPTPTPFVERTPTRICFTKPVYWCDIYPVGVTENNEVGTIDSAVDAAWYMYGAYPGQEGNCIINGHVSWKQQKGTFAYLKEMEIGEEVAIELEDGAFIFYEVVSIEYIPYDAFPPEVLSQKGDKRLTLITCEGDYDRRHGTSLTRVVVVCHEKEGDESQAPPEASVPVATP